MNYLAAINDALGKMREWMEQTGMAPQDLPDSPWALPKDCPIWEAGLSMAQAAAITRQCKSEKTSNLTAKDCAKHWSQR